MNNYGKKIVFVNQSTGYLTIDVINCFAKEYEKVALIYGTMTEEKHRLDEKVKKSRVMKKTRTSNFGRFLRWLIASLQIHILLITKYKQYEVFYYTLPPFAYLGSLFLRRKISIMVFDVYPDVLKITGVKEKNLIFKVWSWANKQVFAKTHRIYTIGNNLDSKLKKYTSNNRIYTVPLWSTLSGCKLLNKSENYFSKKYGFDEKFVIQYSGNMGRSNDIELLINLAEKLKDVEKMHFVFIGRGTKVDLVKFIIMEKKLDNCTILPFQPKEMIRYSLSNADIGVVLVDKHSAEMSVPSKLFNMMAVGSAILAISPPSSEICNILNKYKNGFYYSNSEMYKIENSLREIYLNQVLLNEMKNNSLKAAKDFTEENAGKVLEIYRL